MTSWLCILNRENFEIVKKRFVWGVSERHKKVLAKAKPGDTCAFYTISEGSGASHKEPAIGGIFEIISGLYEDQSDIFPSKQKASETYPYRVQLKAVKLFHPKLPFKPLINDLKFIVNKEKYFGYIRGWAMREIPEEDMELIISQTT